MLKILIMVGLIPSAGLADVVFAARTIRPGEQVEAGDLELRNGAMAGTFGRAEEVLGMEARVVLYAGRPIARGSLRAPALVHRNGRVELLFRRNGLEIRAEGRALERASAGEQVSVLNSASHARVVGTVLADGRVLVE